MQLWKRIDCGMISFNAVRPCLVIDPSKNLLPLHIGIFHSKKLSFYINTTQLQKLCWLVVSMPFEKYDRQSGNLPQLGVKIKKYLKPPPSLKPLNKTSNQQIRHFHHQSLTFSISPFKSSNSPASAWTSNGSNSMAGAKSRVFEGIFQGVEIVWFSHTFGKKIKWPSSMLSI